MAWYLIKYRDNFTFCDTLQSSYCTPTFLWSWRYGYIQWPAGWLCHWVGSIFVYSSTKFNQNKFD